MVRKPSAPAPMRSPTLPSHKATRKVEGYYEARYVLRRAMIVACGPATGRHSPEKRKRKNVATGDKPKTPLKRRHTGTEVQDGATAATEAVSCASCTDEEQVDASSEESLVSFVASVRGKRRVLHIKPTNQVRASQVGKTPSSVCEATANPTTRQQAEEPAVVLARKVRQRKGRPTASGEAAKVLLARTRAKRATQGNRRELSQRVQLRKQRDANERKENGRRQVTVRWSPAPAKRRTRRVSKTLVPKKPALSRTRSASNKKASKDQVSASSDVIGAADHHSLLGASRDGEPFCGPVVFASVLPPSVAVEGGRQPLLNCDSTDPQAILTTSVTVPGSSEAPCALTQEPPRRGRGKVIPVKAHQPILAMETALIKDPVIESCSVRRSCAVTMGSRFDRGDMGFDADTCVVFSSYCEDVDTGEYRACRRDVLLQLTEEDCRPTAVPQISPSCSADGRSDLAAATCSLLTPDDRTNHLRARELSAAVSKQASATSARIGLPDFAQSEAPESSANAATIAQFHCGEDGTTTSRRIREEADAADGIARPHEPVFGLVSSPQKDCQSSLISLDDGSSIVVDDKCASSQGGSEDGDAIFGAECVSSEETKRVGDLQGGSGDEYSSRNCVADENMALELCADSNVPVPDSVASRRSWSSDDCRLVQSVEDEQCNEQRRQCCDVMHNNIAPEPSRGGGDEMSTQSKILLSIQRVSIDKNTSDTGPESTPSCQQRNSVNGENGIVLLESPSAEKRGSDYGDVCREYQNIPRERSHSPYDTSEPSLHAVDSALLEPGNSVACLERRLADGDRLGVYPEDQKVTYLQRRSIYASVIGESEDDTSFGRSCATDGWLDKSERLPSQRRRSPHVDVPVTAQENDMSRQPRCGGGDLLPESTILDPPKTATSEQVVEVESQNSPPEPRESPVTIPEALPLQLRLSRDSDHGSFVAAESEESAAARTQSADEGIDDLENFLTQQTWPTSSLVADLERLPSLKRWSALEETRVAEADNPSCELDQPIDNASGASEEFIRLGGKNGLDDAVVQAQYSLRPQAQPDSNDAFPSQLGQPADEEPLSQCEDIPCSEIRSTDDSGSLETTEAEKLHSFTMQYSANGGHVSEHFSSRERGPDTCKSVSQQTQCPREEPLPASQTENLPSDQTHADADVLVVSETIPVRFGRSAAFSERTSTARTLKTHRRADRQTVPLRYVHYPPSDESELPASLRRRPAADALASQSIPCQSRASANDEPSAGSDGAACFQNSSTDEDLLIVSEVFPPSWSGSGADDDDVIIESSDSDSGRGESASDVSETSSSSSERRWSGRYDVPALSGGLTSCPIRPFHLCGSVETAGSCGRSLRATAQIEQEAASTPGKGTKVWDLRKCVRDALFELDTVTALHMLRLCREEKARRRVFRLYRVGHYSRASGAYAAQIRGIMRSAIERKRLQWNRIAALLPALGSLGCRFPEPRRCSERGC
ncbi:uncharacterized protein [Dermacentor albipictus]|uniref:uncharacterized protein n=1 Tax=Dermacentor albipictus TaxID=60249 RepID=UPI0038FC56EB